MTLYSNKDINTLAKAKVSGS